MSQPSACGEHRYSNLGSDARRGLDTRRQNRYIRSRKAARCCPCSTKGAENAALSFVGKDGPACLGDLLGDDEFGQQWGFGADEATSHQVLDAYAARGGNFLDTANKYHRAERPKRSWANGCAQSAIGWWWRPRSTLAMNHEDPNTAGNHRKNMVLSVERTPQAPSDRLHRLVVGACVG